MGTKREKALIKLFNELTLNELTLVSTDLIPLIIGYDTAVQWEGKQVQEIKTDGFPFRIASDQQYLYVCVLHSNNVARYTLDTLQLVDKIDTPKPSAIEISGHELYIHEEDGPIRVFNIFTKEILRQWNPTGYSRAIKLHGENLYYANSYDHQIYVYNLSGDLVKQFGKSGTKPGEFRCPYGMDIDDQFIFIADYSNNRVQVFHLSSCTYSHQWGTTGNENGQFASPHELRLDQDLCYVGDTNGIQVFAKDGEFLYRFGKNATGSGTGEFNNVRGIFVGNRLYVSDSHNHRVVVLQ